ncbi:beta-ketoacyl synthase N-terminal-like domain-containing protein [Actinomycetes bacterium M1A6_2h]
MHSQRIEHGMKVAGLGAVTGYGWGRDALWRGLVSGKPAAQLVGGYGVERNEEVWLARVPHGGHERDGSRSGRAMAAAVREALGDARGRGWRPGRTVGLLHAVVLSEADEWRSFHLDDGGHRRVRDYLTLMPSTPVSKLMREFDFHGPAMNISAMCSSGNAGLITAKMWLDAGIADDVVFVSTDLSLTPENIEHFTALGVSVVDTEPLDACRPFQEGSRGFPAGEASVAYVLSRRVDRPYLYVLGGSMSHDGFHVTSVDPDLTYVRQCVTDALDNAGVAADSIRYINAHGPGTAQCDRAEATILDTVFSSRPEIYSVKPLVGHCQGAAASVEIAATALAFEHGIIPAPPTVSAGHPRLLDGPTELQGGLTLKSSLGMGGHNSAVVLAPPA